ncbi:MAG: hypothetical protein MJ137_02830 [Clostridia bacterium]|nr:hypothetical protein [Clostridia bacterium]
MITVKRVKTKKDEREFLNFPIRLYKGCPFFVPPMYADEKAIFSPDYYYYDTCEAAYFLAEDDGKTVGRISAIIQHASNEKQNEKRARFTRFDAIDSQEVADALFKAAETWAAEKGMDTVCGPLGFSDLEREGLLIEGFDQLATFEEQYNYDYYQRLIENCGYEKEVDWLESKLYAPKEKDESISKAADFLMKRYKLHVGTAKNVKEFIDKYVDGIFELIDKSYSKLYGTVPISDKVKKATVDNFLMVVKLKYISVILDENENIVCFGICVPSISKALVGTSGKLTPVTLVKLLRCINKPDVLDFMLIGVEPEWMNRGVAAIFFSWACDLLKEVDHAETNLNLEDNYAIRNTWKRFDGVNHKRRRSFVKKIGD